MSILDKDMNSIDISLDTLRELVDKDITYEQSLNDNKELTNNYKYIIKGLGFNDFQELYLYCELKDKEPKDNNIIKSIKRDNDIIDLFLPIEQKEITKKDYGGVSLLHVDSRTNGNIDKGCNIYELKKTLEKLESTLVDTTTFNKDCNIYKTYHIDNDILAIIGYNYTKEFLELKDYTGHNTVKSVGIRAIKDGLDIAKENNLGFCIKDNLSENGIKFILSLGFTKKGNYYIMDKDYISKWV
ncbi:hypothetical protein [Mammaliicoccus virus vB_MscM-PMS2]|nr:hypothetical protein [Mammaliicoccus virus vB_MscM-PMS2]